MKDRLKSRYPCELLGWGAFLTDRYCVSRKEAIA